MFAEKVKHRLHKFWCWCVLLHCCFRRRLNRQAVIPNVLILWCRMYFKDISIHSWDHNLPFNKDYADFNVSTDLVQDLFWYNIPKKFNVLDMKKLNIIITRDDIPNKYAAQKFIVHYDGIGLYYHPNFDFKHYFSISSGERSKVILNILRETINYILKDDEEKRDYLLSICDKIEENNFQLRTISKKYSKWHKSRKYKANVIFQVDPDGQNAFVELIDKDDNVIKNEHIVTNHFDEYNLYLSKTKWVENDFIVYSRDGEIFKQISI